MAEIFISMWHLVKFIVLTYFVCAESDVLVTNNNGKMARILVGRRKYFWHKPIIRPKTKKLYMFLRFKTQNMGNWMIHQESIFSGAYDGWCVKNGTYSRSDGVAEQGSKPWIMAKCFPALTLISNVYLNPTSKAGEIQLWFRWFCFSFSHCSSFGLFDLTKIIHLVPRHNLVEQSRCKFHRSSLCSNY